MQYMHFTAIDLTNQEIINIIFGQSGYGEVWYRAWFGSKRPRVRIPILRPPPYGNMDTWFHRDFLIVKYMYDKYLLRDLEIDKRFAKIIPDQQLQNIQE